MASTPTIDKKVLRTLDPLGTLGADKLDEIASKATIELVRSGRPVFRQGERDKRVVYLLSGNVELKAADQPRGRTVKARSAEATRPLGPGTPRPFTALARTDVQVLSIDSDLLEILLDDGPPDAYEVTEISVDEGGDSWMIQFLQSRAFLHLPTENIQALLLRMEEVRVKRGDVIVRQDGDDDYYYIVKQGRCEVSRRPSPEAKPVKLAELGAGDGFGEEALITGGRRNATVAMLEDGCLMRLGRDDFRHLLVAPLTRPVVPEEAIGLFAQGAALVDIRLPEAFARDGIKGAVNIPLSVLRLKLASLPGAHAYVVAGEDPGHSTAAAFLLSQQGLQAYVLNDPSRALPRLLGGGQDLSAPVTAAAAPSQTVDGDDQARQRAEETARQAKAAEAARDQAAREAERFKAEAEAARRQAEAQANRIQREAAEKQQAEVAAIQQRAARETERARVAEAARHAAEQEAARLKAEAEAARRDADDIATRVHAQAQTTQQQRTELEAVRRRAEEEARRAAAAAAAREQAEREAARQKAEAEAARREAEREAARIQQEFAKRQQAELAAVAQRVEEEARRAQAADQARRQAEAEAARLRSEAEAARREAEQANSKLRSEAEALRRRAEEEAARLRAEAEAARREAEAEAARVKAEAEAARRQAEQEVKRILNDEAERQQEKLESVRKAIEAAAEQAKAAQQARLAAEAEASRLKAEAEAVRQRAQQEAERLRAEAAAARRRASEENTRQKTDEIARIQAALETAERRAREEAERAKAAEKARREADRRAQAVMAEAEQRMQRAEQARKLAANIVTKLQKTQHRGEQKRADTQVRQRRQAQQARQEREEHEKLQQQLRMPLPGADVQPGNPFRRLEDKLVLEGNEDVFVFITPSPDAAGDIAAAPEPSRRAKRTAENRPAPETPRQPSAAAQPATRAGLPSPPPAASPRPGSGPRPASRPTPGGARAARAAPRTAAKRGSGGVRAVLLACALALLGGYVLLTDPFGLGVPAPTPVADAQGTRSLAPTKAGEGSLMRTAEAEFTRLLTLLADGAAAVNEAIGGRRDQDAKPAQTPEK